MWGHRPCYPFCIGLPRNSGLRFAFVECDVRCELSGPGAVASNNLISRNSPNRAIGSGANQRQTMHKGSFNETTAICRHISGRRISCC